MKAGLSKLGEPSFLDGYSVGPVAIERGVDVFVGDPGRSDDNYTVTADVAVLPFEAQARVGQTLAHPDGTFVLTRLLSDSGYSRSFVVVAQ